MTRNNALAETTIGLYQNRVRARGLTVSDRARWPAPPTWRTSRQRGCNNTSRLMHRLGRRPPTEAEAEYYAHQ
jgi:putative transposase